MAGPKAKGLEERFWPRVKKTETCWLWTGAISNGYGFLALKPVKVAPKKWKFPYVLTHRFSYELAFGPIPHSRDGQRLFVCHRCDVKNCVRPDHLFLGTNQENLTDAKAKGRPLGGACRRKKGA